MALPRSSAAGSRPAYLDGLYRDTYTSCREYSNTPPASLHSYTSSISTTSTASTYSLRSAYQSARPLSPPIEECNSDTLSIRSKKPFLSPKRRFRFFPRPKTYPQTPEQFEPPAPVRPVYSQIPAPPSTPPRSGSSSPLRQASSPVREENPVVPAALHRRPSLPKLQTTFAPLKFGPPEAQSTYERKALPAIPGQSQPPSRQTSSSRYQPVRQISKSRPSMKRHASALELKTPATDLGCQKCYYYAARNCNGYVLGGDAGDACETCLVSYSCLHREVLHEC